jgi:hypothetical protein
MVTDSAVDPGPLPRALVAQLEAAIVSLRANDQFRPVHLLVPNHVLGTLVSRALFADTGYLNIRCELPHEFAWRIAATDCLTAGLLAVPEEVDLAVVLAAAASAVEDAGHDTPDYLRRAVAMAGFGRAALRTLRDLAAADVSADALEAFAPKAPDPEKLRVLARIDRGRRQSLADACLIVRESLYRCAAADLSEAGYPGVVLVGAPPSSRAFEELVARLCALRACAWVGLRA